MCGSNPFFLLACVRVQSVHVCAQTIPVIQNIILIFFSFLFVVSPPCLQISEMWKKLRDALKEPSPYQVECQKPKTILLDAGEMFDPYAWAVGLSSN